MKLLLGSSAILLLLTLSVLQVGVTSCTKDHNIYDTVTVIKRDTVTVKDTVIIKDTMLTAEILTANRWKTQEIRAVLAGDSLFYVRGGLNNNFNFDNEYFAFYADGTGLLTDATGLLHAIKDWKFTNDTHTQLTFLALEDNSQPTIFSLMTWDNIRYKNKNINDDEYWHANTTGANYHGQAIRIPE